MLVEDQTTECRVVGYPSQRRYTLSFSSSAIILRADIGGHDVIPFDCIDNIEVLGVMLILTLYEPFMDDNPFRDRKFWFDKTTAKNIHQVNSVKKAIRRYQAFVDRR